MPKDQQLDLFFTHIHHLMTTPTPLSGHTVHAEIYTFP
jgi:hypothetical protein